MWTNEAILSFWIEALGIEAGELLGVPAQTADADRAPSGRAYHTQIFIDGFAQGVLHITAPTAEIARFVDCVPGKSRDADAAWTEATLEAWRGLMEGTATRLSAQLAARHGEPCRVALSPAGTIEESYSASGSEISASGSSVRHWMLKAGSTQVAISASVNLEFQEQQSAPSVASVEKEEDATREVSPAEVPGDDETSDASLGTQDSVPGFQRSTEMEEAGSVDGGEQAKPQPTVACQGPTQPARDAAETVLPNATADVSGFSAESPAAASRDAAPMSQSRIDLLLDIELEATLRFGALELPLREVLELGPGDVLPLDRHVREPVDLVVGDRIVARGEVVLVSGNFGLQITEVAEPRKRLETIRCLF